MSKTNCEDSVTSKQSLKNNNTDIKNNFNYLILLIVTVVVSITCIMVVPSLSKGKAQETAIAEHFINEKVSLHNGEYEITVNYAKFVSDISYLKSAKDKNQTTKTGNYLEIELDIVKLKKQIEKSHTLKLKDFALKSNAKIQLPFYGSCKLYSSDNKELTIEPNENGCITNVNTLEQINAISDYSWINREIRFKEKVKITLNFVIDKETDEKNVFILTADFLDGNYRVNKGTEIALINRIIKPDLYC